MMSFFTSLFVWMPIELQLVCIGVVALFFLFTILNIVRFIFDIIPFL